MSDYSESGAQPVEDAAVPDPPTVDAVLAERDRAEDDDSPEAPAADPTYDEPGDNPLAAEDDDD
jgi:hypothetical protein